MVKLPLPVVPRDVAFDGDQLPLVLGACLCKSMELALAKAAVPISSPGSITSPVSLGINVY